MPEARIRNPQPARPRWLRGVALAVSGVLCTATLAALPLAPAVAADVQLTSYVNPFIGTQDEGAAFPGAAMPFGMVQMSPDNGYATGYSYDNSKIRGFSLMHLSGAGCGIGGFFPILPMAGVPSSNNYSDYALSYSHTGESASPGRYAVNLASGSGTIAAELSATTRTGLQKYTFPSINNATVVLNAGYSLSSVVASEVRIDPANKTVWAKTTVKGFCADTASFSVYTKTVFDRSFSGYGTWTGSTFNSSSTTASATGKTGAWVQFDATSDADVEVQSSLSYVDYAGAEANLAAEQTTVASAETAAAAAWEKRLESVAVTSSDADQLQVFYTGLYHSMISPNVGSDVDGRYRGWDGAIHNVSTEGPDFVYYQNYSLWDTYRTQQQLLALIAPKQAADITRSLVLEGEQLWAPRWGYGPVETNTMTGDPITPTLVGMWSTGLVDSSLAERAYAVLKKSADEVPPADSTARGRSGNVNYIAKGFVGYTSVSGSGDSDVFRGGSATLEYALADAVLSTMATALGHAEDAARYRVRAQNYRSVWDQQTKAMRARTANGQFVSESDPSQSPGFHEGTAIQYQWLVQQDVPGLIDLMGGVNEANKRLDNFFAYSKLLADPSGTAHHTWVNGSYSYYGTTTYNPNNEPDLHAPYIYLWTGQPWKTTDVVRAALTLFTTGPSGVTGNDDLGTMSSWLVLSSLGIYPIMPGTDRWGLSAPAFEAATIALDQAYYPASASSLKITAPGVSAASHYIRSASLGGQPLDRAWIDGTDLRRAGTLAFTVGSEHSDWATSAAASPGSMVQQEATPDRVTAAWPTSAIAVTPGRTTDVGVTLVAQVAGATASGTVTIASSGPVTGGSAGIEVASNSLPATVESRVPVRLAADAAPGVYPVTATVSIGGATDVQTLSLVVRGTSWMQDAFRARGIADRGSAGADLDGLGSYYITDALEAQGVYPGVDTSVPGLPSLRYRLSAETLDSLFADGQRLRTDALAGATQIALIGAGMNGSQSAELTLQYTDGRAQRVVVRFDDWCATSTTQNVVAKMAERGSGTGSNAITCRLMASDPIPLTGSLAAIRFSVNDRFVVFGIASDATASALSLTSSPAVTGSASVGSTLGVADPVWSAADAQTSYQWLRDGDAISGADASFRVVTPADAGHQLQVRITGTAKGWESTSVLSPAVTVAACVASFASASTISGDPVVGASLVARPGTTAPSGLTLGYQWFSGGTAIPGATSDTLVVTPDLLGTTISVAVSASSQYCAVAESQASASQAVREGTLALVNPPLVSGTTVVGGTLTVVPGSYLPQASSSAIQWLADGEVIAGATRPSFVPSAALVGRTVSARVTSVTPGYRDRVETAVAGVVRRSAITVSGQATISGTAKLGAQLTAVAPSYSRAVTLSYRWLRDGHAVSGMTASTYLLTPDDVGRVLAVSITGTAADGVQVTTVSAPTASVAAGTLTLASAPRITGKAKVGKQLTLVGGTASMPAGRQIQWLRNGVAIGKATGTTLKLTKKDRGKKITVRVVFSRDGYSSLQAVSKAVKVA
jgi:predicted alpha-1,2-mannosidase